MIKPYVRSAGELTLDFARLGLLLVFRPILKRIDDAVAGDSEDQWGDY